MKTVQPSFLHSDNPRVVDTAFPFRHCIPMQIRFTDIDMLGHLNNNVYLMFMDLAKIDYFTSVIGHKINMHDFDLVVANMNIDFLAPTFFGENIDVWTQVTHIGPRSVRMEQRVVETETGQIKSVGRVIMAGFDPVTNSAQPISPLWAAAIEKFEQHPLRQS